MSITNGSSTSEIQTFPIQPNPEQPLSEEWLKQRRKISEEIVEHRTQIGLLENKENEMLIQELMPRIRYVVSIICQGDAIPKGSLFVYQLEHVGDVEWNDWVVWNTHKGWWSVRENQQRFENDYDQGLFRFPTKWLFEDFEEDLKERVEKHRQAVKAEDLKRKQREEEYAKKKLAAREKLTKEEQELLGL